MKKASAEEKIERMRKENFRFLVLSYACDMLEDSADIMAEKALRGIAHQWSGCVSCAFSRKKKEKERNREGWLHRTCALGLKQDTCREYLDFPEE